MAEFNTKFGRLDANEAYLKFMGLSLDEWLKSGIEKTLYPEDHAEVLKLRRGIVRTKKSYDEVIRHMTPRGPEYVRWWNIAICNRKGKLTRIKCYGRPYKQRSMTDRRAHPRGADRRREKPDNSDRDPV